MGSSSVIKKPASATIQYAYFQPPTTLGSITIQGITGIYDSFTVTRTGGGLTTYTSPIQTSPVNSFTDPTALVNNAQYTYTITPTYKGVAGGVFSAILNFTTGLSNSMIYSLATVAGLAATYNGAGSNLNQISFTYTGTNNGTTNNYTSLSIQYPAGIEIAQSNFVLGSNTFTANVLYSPNTQYTHSIYAINGDGVRYNTPATITTCTWAQITAAAFSTPNNRSVNIIGSITGTYTKFNVTRNGTTVTGSGATGTSYADSSGLATNTQYTYTLIPLNALSYASQAFTNITNPANAGTPGKIYTLAIPDTLNLSYSNSTCSTTNISFTWIGTANNFTTLSIQTSAGVVLGTPAYSTTTQTFTSTTNPYTANIQDSLKIYAVNGDGVGSGINYAYTALTVRTWGSIATSSAVAASTVQINVSCSGPFAGAYLVWGTGGVGTGSLAVYNQSTITNQSIGGLSANTSYTIYIYPYITINSTNYPSSAPGPYGTTSGVSYGTVTATTPAPLSFTGNGFVVTTSGIYSVITFTASGTISLSVARTVEFYLLGGGGGGGTGNSNIPGGGGGGGGCSTSSSMGGGGVSFTAGVTYTITIGVGGGSNTKGGNTSMTGGSIPTITSGGGNAGTAAPASGNVSGGTGSITAGTGGNYDSTGGTGPYVGTNYGGPLQYGGGGGGGSSSTYPMTGGNQGGGTGGTTTNPNGSNATSYGGGGGGGGQSSSNFGGKGGDGIAILWVIT